MDQGEEAGSESLKEDPLDFALWKARKPDEDSGWPSPWGEGRPGWHIECSAMAEEILGTDFEIHGGGIDLVFPHHENEIAQTEAARGAPLARLWMHNGMVRTAEEKMSKSLGNIFQLSAALDRYGREAVIAYLISGHYRQPLEFSEQALDAAAARIERIRNFVTRAGGAGRRLARRTRSSPSAAGRCSTRWPTISTPRGRSAALFELDRRGKPQAAGRGRRGAREVLAAARPGVAARPGRGRRIRGRRSCSRERQEARAGGDFERADEIRDRLSALGFEVRDTAKGPRLVRCGHERGRASVPDRAAPRHDEPGRTLEAAGRR